MRSLVRVALACVAFALLAAPSFAQCSAAAFCAPQFQSYQAPAVIPQAVAVPVAFFAVPSAPTVQLQVQQQYSYGVAQPVVVQPLVQKVQVQQLKVQKVQQVQVKPPAQRIRQVTRTRLFGR